MTTRSISRSLSIVLVLTLAACSSSPKGQPDSGADRGPIGADSMQPPSGWTFAAEDTGQSPAVALKLEAQNGSEATVQLVARGIASLQGVAFRLGFDPKQIEIVKSEQGAAWDDTGKQFIARFAPRSEGELWGGIGFHGSNRLVAESEVVLARVTVKLIGATTTKLAFLAKRNTCIDPSLKQLTVTWLGGTFEPLK